MCCVVSGAPSKRAGKKSTANTHVKHGRGGGKGGGGNCHQVCVCAPFPLSLFRWPLVSICRTGGFFSWANFHSLRGSFPLPFPPKKSLRYAEKFLFPPPSSPGVNIIHGVFFPSSSFAFFLPPNNGGNMLPPFGPKGPPPPPSPLSLRSLSRVSD